MSPWGVVGGSGRLIIIRRTRQELVALLIEHQHGYDSDCGMDYGCSCGWGEETEIKAYDNDGARLPIWQDEAFAAHLASVLIADDHPSDD